MNSYSKFTDLQINELVATRLKKKCLLTEESVLAYMDSGYRTFDPCNNPADAMPIIIENGIAIRPYKTATPVAFNAEIGEFYGHSVYNENVLRAAMELFLLMKDEENSNGN
ncbi:MULTISPECIES: phage protein NinX family protein [unclassified Providencia]|uniref:phage protein NinX family protein n=1 Tax=unclassified Providencia TaxID=2633465 RepID=UPI002349C318|nr:MULTISPECIES: phage protein NinX family protein [unclassified Providencia]